MPRNDIDIHALAEEARRLGYDEPERLVNRLQRIIARNAEYLEYRERKGRTGSYNEIVAEDTAVLAAVIEFIANNM